MQPMTTSITCTHCATKYKGGYPKGFLEKALTVLVAGDPMASVLHIPGGRADLYNNATNHGYGPNHRRIDLDPKTTPDLCLDVRDWSGWGWVGEDVETAEQAEWSWDDILQEMDLPRNPLTNPEPAKFKAAIVDRDYSRQHAEYLGRDPKTWPNNLRKLTEDVFNLVEPSGLVGVLDFHTPALSKDKYYHLWTVNVNMPMGAQVRQFTVWQRKEGRRLLEGV